MKRLIRGNAAPETALALSFTLLVLFGVVQLTTTAFYQIAADGASFVGAHDTVQNLGSPTSANSVDAATAARIAFGKIISTSISAVNPSQSTFETDVNQVIPGISALGNPMSLTVNSRLIEESAGTATPLPANDCTGGALAITNNGTSSSTTSIGNTFNNGTSMVPTTPISLIGAQVGTLLSNPTAPGVGITLTNVPVLTKITNGYKPIAPDLTQVTALLGTLTSTLNALPIVGTLVEKQLGPDLTSVISQALNGTFNSLAAINQVNSILNGIPGAGSLVATLDQTLLNGTGGAGTGLLGSNGPLAAIAAAETTLDGADANVNNTLSAACKTVLGVAGS